MNCDQTRRLVSAYMDQELTGQEMLEISAHLEFCPTCTREWQEINDVRRLLRALSPPSPSDHAQQKLAARLMCEEAGNSAYLREFVLPRLSVLWGEADPQGRRHQGRRTAYALALASVVVLAVAAPFAPSTGDAAGSIVGSHFTGPHGTGSSTQLSSQNSLLPSLSLTGEANAIEADPLHDDTFGGYVQGDVTMAGFQTSGFGPR